MRPIPYHELPSPARSPWIVTRRQSRPDFDVQRPHTFFAELERGPSSDLLPTLTVLLRSRECPWRCLMCDLWKSTVPYPIPQGAIPAQLDIALSDSRLFLQEPPRQIKLYNSGSFFDVAAVPPVDYPMIAGRLQNFERVIVECHPRLVGHRALQFNDLLRHRRNNPSTTLPAPQLEIAMGLETIHPLALERLNKGMTLADFTRAAAFLRHHHIDLRAFILVQPPFVPASEAVQWTIDSVRFAFDCGATAVSIIPTRIGNGALDTLAAQNQFTSPTLATLESAFDSCLALGRGRVFADLWDLERFSLCADCFGVRRDRLQRLNLDQSTQPAVRCSACKMKSDG